MSNLVKCSKKAFEEFIKNYPRKLERDFFMDYDSFYDFSLGNGVDGESLVAKASVYGDYYIKEDKMLTINEYQKKAHETADYPIPVCGGNYMDWDYPVHALAEEAGEVAGKFAKAVRDEEGYISDERKEAIIKELGDVCWFVAEICTVLNTNLEDVMQKNLDKLASRKARGVIHGEGDNR